MLIETGHRRLVHLNALRAFEAAARHLSFVAAAEELNVTPPAVSQHIRTLEDYLGVRLFVRSKVGLSLTPEARGAYGDIKDGLERLAAGMASLRGSGVDHIVTMTVPPSFAAKWLLPRIEGFREKYTDYDIRLDTTNRLVDLAGEGVDVGVRYGLGGYAGLECERLLGEDVFPVCSPNLIAPGGGKIEIRDLARMTLIHDTTIDFDPAFPTWRAWFRARGIDNVDPRGLQFNSSVLAIQAAIEGQGVALGRSVIVARDLQAGRLVRPFNGVEETHCAYYIVFEKRVADSPKVKAVRNWLREEAASSPSTAAH
jgi:LysR family glycine cleavage system transcriptional activator